jgi:signal peptidase I
VTDDQTPSTPDAPGRRRAAVPDAETAAGEISATPDAAAEQGPPAEPWEAASTPGSYEPIGSYDPSPAYQRGSHAARGGAPEPGADAGAGSGPDSSTGRSHGPDGGSEPSSSGAARTKKAAVSGLGSFGRFVREVVIIIVVALVASALLRAFVVQAFFVPSGSMLPTIQLHDRILVSRIGDIQRGEVVVFQDPGNWIPPQEQPPPPTGIRKFMEFIGVLPASGHEHLVKRVIGLPGDHVVCCSKDKLVINGQPVDESSFIKPGHKPADNVKFDVVVPAGHIFVLGDNRYVSGDSSRHLTGQGAFVPEDLVTGRAFAVIWPASDIQVLHIPSAYDDVPPPAQPAPKEGIITVPHSGKN